MVPDWCLSPLPGVAPPGLEMSLLRPEVWAKGTLTPAGGEGDGQ